MDALFASGRIVDVILVIVAIEALLLTAWRLRAGRGPSLLSLIVNLLSGAALMLAIRAALTDADWPVIAGWLCAALLAHVADLAVRLREGGAARTETFPNRTAGRSGSLELKDAPHP